MAENREEIKLGSRIVSAPDRIDANYNVPVYRRSWVVDLHAVDRLLRLVPTTNHSIVDKSMKLVCTTPCFI